MLMGMKDLPGRRIVSRLLQRDRRARTWLLKSMPKHSICAEIGVHEGDFSKLIIDTVEPERLHLIDPWVYQPGPIYEDALYGTEGAGSQAAMDQRYFSVLARFQREIAEHRVVVHRAYSDQIANILPDDYLGWVYIDGNHLYEYVKRDLQLFRAKVKLGGYLTGDDYGDGGWWSGGVKTAVDEYVAIGLARKLVRRHTQFLLLREA